MAPSRASAASGGAFRSACAPVSDRPLTPFPSARITRGLMHHSRRLAGLLLGLVFATRALAQTGGLEVVVTDAESKTPLPGATVLLTSATQQVPATALVTDAKGKAAFPVLRGGGGYAVEVRLAGYATLRLPDLKISLGKASVLPVGLFPEMKEDVAVSAKREGVALDETASKTTLSSEFIEDLPV